MSDWIHHQKTSLRSSSQLLTSLRTGFLFVILMLLGFHPAVGSLGETEEQCDRRYGTEFKEVKKYDAATRTKEIGYTRTDAKYELMDLVWIKFVDGTAVWVQHFGNDTLTNSVIDSCLKENAQGHQWALTSSNGEDIRYWKRDDGVLAEQAVVGKNRKLTIWSPSSPVPQQTVTTYHPISYKHTDRIIIVVSLSVLLGALLLVSKFRHQRGVQKACVYAAGIALVLLCTLLVLKLCSITISPPPLEFTGHRISDAGEFDVTIINNSDSPLFDIELEFQHLLTSSKDIKKFKLLRLNPNERVTLTAANLNGWSLARGTSLDFEARGYLFPSMVYIGGDPDNSKSE